MIKQKALGVIAALCLLCAVSVYAQSGDDGDDAQIEELVAGNNAFAFDLYQAIRENSDGNLFYSPYSISQALAMTYAGARGNTETQMAEVLGFTLPQSELHSTFSALNLDLIERGNAEGSEAEGVPPRALHVANALWGERSYPFLPDYLTLTQTQYGAGLRLVDFRGNPDAARAEINDWVADNTEDRIQNIVPEDAITEDTRLALANAIYFKANWLDTFNEAATSDAPFTLMDGSTVDIPFMRQRERFAYVRGEGYQAIELLYQSQGSAMLIILPDDFSAFEAALDEETFDNIVNSMRFAEVNLAMPKFTFEYAINLADTLEAMGMTDAFDEEAADFSGMADIPPGTNLYISSVLHKAFIAVDENGTEAAAATVVIVAEATSAQPDEPVVMTIDRPFLFAIRDQRTGTLLFVGRVLNPSG